MDGITPVAAIKVNDPCVLPVTHDDIGNMEIIMLESVWTLSDKRCTALDKGNNLVGSLDRLAELPIGGDVRTTLLQDMPVPGSHLGGRWELMHPIQIAPGLDPDPPLDISRIVGSCTSTDIHQPLSRNRRQRGYTVSHI